jgi:hypothetical protein
MASTVKASVQMGLHMLTVAKGNVRITWERHERYKYIQIKTKSGPISRPKFSVFVRMGENSEVELQDCSENDVLLQLRGMMRTTRFRPVVLFVTPRGEGIPLFVPKSDVINTRPSIGTEFIGANMMPLNHPPAPIDIL